MAKKRQKKAPKRRPLFAAPLSVVNQLMSKQLALSSSTTSTLSPASSSSSISSALSRTWTYLTSIMNLIDAVAILPFYLEKFAGIGGGGLGVLRILRLARVFRLFKAPALSEGVTLLGNVIGQSYPSLRLLTFFAMIGCILYGSIIHLCEQGEWHGPNEAAYAADTDDGGNGWPKDGVWLRPDKFGTGKERTPFMSIPRSMWWVMVTATTCGYGDMFPTTDLGKVVATLTMLSGVLVLALPITIISSNFTTEYEKLEDAKDRHRVDKSNLNMNKTTLLYGPNPNTSNPFEKRAAMKLYKGCLSLRMERQLEMLLGGARTVSLLDALVRKVCGGGRDGGGRRVGESVEGLLHCHYAFHVSFFSCIHWFTY
jgi:hypothetical protein